MNPKYVISLELSKELKELGVKQKSEYIWYRYKPANKDFSLITVNNESFMYAKSIDSRDVEYYSAYLAVELGEILPNGINYNSEGWYDLWIIKHSDNKQYIVSLVRENEHKTLKSFKDTLPEAMGLMVKYLKEEK